MEPRQSSARDQRSPSLRVPSSGRRWSALLWTALAWTSGCGSAGPWGHAREYEPLGDEEQALEGAGEFDPVMANRQTHKWVGKRVSIFGVVEKLVTTPSGNADVLLSVRVLQDRNLCETATEDSCRVTVSEHEFTRIHALVHLRPEDERGEVRVGPGSLLRVIGKVAEKPHPKTGAFVVETEYHRHWPLKYYVTTRAREYMLR